MARRDSRERAMEKVGGFATARKNVVFQIEGREWDEEHILWQIKKDVLEKGIKDEDIESVDIYVKLEEKAAFYVVNKDITGRIDFV